MAYNKVTNKIEEKEISYLNKDYTSFKNSLLDFARIYFPNTHNDFTENNPSTMFLEMASYVGDVLSFYTDDQIKETFFTLAQDRTNIFNMCYSLGYKPKVTSTSAVDLELFQIIPSKGSGDSYNPDFNYALNVHAGSTFLTGDGVSFYLQDDVRFSYSSSFDLTSYSVYQYDSSDNPEYYLLKKLGKAISARTKTQTVTVGDPVRYFTTQIFDTNIIGIESVTDSDGNEWSEVEYLAQDTKFVEEENTRAVDFDLFQYRTEVPYLLKIKKVPRRFVCRFTETNKLELQFGAGISDKSDEQIIPNPDNIGLGIKEGKTNLDIAYDPSNFLYTKAYGQVPANTTLTITYLVGGGVKSNVPASTITEVDLLRTTNNPNLNGTLLDFCKRSIGVTNPKPAVGGGGSETLAEIKRNAMATFAAQHRTVTKEDYIIRTLSMDPKFGRVAKAYITQDDQLSPLTTEPNRIPNPLALNLYTLGYDRNKNLTTLNNAIKNNLSTYLERYRMLTDAINIKDAFIINIQLDFSITVYKNKNNEETLLNCINELTNYFNIDKWQVNQPIIISEVENLIGAVKGVQTVEELNIKSIVGGSYSKYSYDIPAATNNKVIYPSLDPMIFELKFPKTDIKGRVTTY
jgi:hypothetical protein